MSLDDFDNKLLALLTKNSRQPLSRLASKLKCTRRKVSQRLKKLEENAVILKYTALINPWSLGKHLIAELNMKVELSSLKKIIKKLISFPEVCWVYESLGDYDLRTIILEDNLETYYNFVLDKVASLGGVIQADSEIILNRYFYGTPVDIYANNAMKKTLDAVDTRICMMLRENSRITNQDIAQAVKLTNQAVRYRINNLEKNHVILSYPLLLDRTKMGMNFSGGIKLMVDPEKFNDIVKNLANRKEVVWIGEVSGRYGLSIMMEAKDRFTFRNYLRAISAIDGVRNCISYVYVGVQGKYFV